MKVTFPHLGSMQIFCEAVAKTAGIPYIAPPETIRRFDLPRKSYATRAFQCGGCGNQREVIELLVDHQVVACGGDLCERYWYPQNH
jgi:hypothetical protein